MAASTSSRNDAVVRLQAVFTVPLPSGQADTVGPVGPLGVGVGVGWLMAGALGVGVGACVTGPALPPVGDPPPPQASAPPTAIDIRHTRIRVLFMGSLHVHAPRTDDPATARTKRLS